MKFILWFWSLVIFFTISAVSPGCLSYAAEVWGFSHWSPEETLLWFWLCPTIDIFGNYLHTPTFLIIMDLRKPVLATRNDLYTWNTFSTSGSGEPGMCRPLGLSWHLTGTEPLPSSRTVSLPLPSDLLWLILVMTEPENHTFLSVTQLGPPLHLFSPTKEKSSF